MSRRLGIDRRAVLGLAVIVGGLALWALAFTGGLSTIFSSSTTTVRADFASAEDIVPNDPVRIDGVQVGSVKSVALYGTARGATVTMSIDTTDPIYKDASASILWRTLLGANDAIAINPGTSATGSLGDSTIPQSHDSNQVELDQVTSAFGGGAQPGVRTMLTQLGPALSDHPALGTDLSTLAQIAPAAVTGIGALRGQVQDTDLRNLVHNAGQAAQALSVGTNAAVTQQFVQSAATTLTALGDNPAALRQSVANLDRVYVSGDASVFRQYDKLLAQVNPVVKTLNDSVGNIQPTLVDLKPTLKNTTTLLARAEPVFKKLSPAANSIAAAAAVGNPVITSLNPGLDNLNTFLTGLKAKSPEEGGRSAYEEIGPTFEGLGGITDFFNSDGALMNLTAGLLNQNTQQLLPCLVDFTGEDLLVCQSLSGSLQELMSGGSSLLTSLVGKPGGAAVYGSALRTENKNESLLSNTENALGAKFPALKKFLFPQDSK